MLRPHKTGIFRKACLTGETINISCFSDDAGCIDITDSFYGRQCLGNRLQLFLNRFVVLFHLFLQQADGTHWNRKHLFRRIGNDLRRTVRAFGSTLNNIRYFIGILKSIISEFNASWKSILSELRSIHILCTSSEFVTYIISWFKRFCNDCYVCFMIKCYTLINLLIWVWN